MTDGETPPTDPSDDTHPDDEPSLDDLLTALESELRATEELPVDPAASVWLGEAHAVAADLTRGDPAPAVVHERIGHVQTLLTNVDDADNAAVDTHVAAARRVAASIVALTDASNHEAR